MGTGAGLEALQTFFQSEFKDTNSTHGASYIHKCTIMFQICLKPKSYINRKLIYKLVLMF